MTAVRQFDCAAGEAAVPVIFAVGRERRGQPLPVDEIAGLDVSPVHGAPFGVVGVVLEKQMIFALVGGKAVGVVDPADAAGHMESRLIGLGIRQILFFKVAGLLQHFADHNSRSCLYMGREKGSRGKALLSAHSRRRSGANGALHVISRAALRQKRHLRTSGRWPGADPACRPADRSGADSSQRRRSRS